MSIHTYHKICENPHKEVEGLIAELETVLSRSARYSHGCESAYFINISLTKPYLRVMKRLCANISFIIERKQVSAWVTIIQSEMNREFGPLYESAYADFGRRIESCFNKHGFTGDGGI